MKILVAGSTGLVGKTLIDHYLLKHNVIALSRRSYQFPKNVKCEIVNFNQDFSLNHADHFFICLGYPLELFDLIYMRAKIKPEFEMIDDYNEYDNQSESQSNKEDDLLQIPAFLRRQAN